VSISSALDYDEFVRATSGALFATAFLLTGDTGEAEDLLQETWMAMHRNWARVEAADSAIAYVRRSLTNRFVSTRRRRRLWPAVWSSHRTPVIEDGTQVVLDRILLSKLLASLTAHQRAAIVLRYFDDQPDQGIADALGCGHATVRSLISRGVASMRSEYLRSLEDAVPSERQEARREYF
jgi:RNA polymerase sigma-70 factor (sigma-E family)